MIHIYSKNQNFIGYQFLMDIWKMRRCITKIIGTIGFPVISTSLDIIKALKDSRHKDFLKKFSPAIIRTM